MNLHRTSSSIEILESRIAPAGLVAAAFDAATGILTLTGDGMDNTVDVFLTGPNSYRVLGTGTDIDVASREFKDFAGKLSSVLIFADAGADVFTLTNLLTLKDLTFNGGAGDDSFAAYNVSTKAGATVNFDADGGSAAFGRTTSVGGDLTVNYGTGGGLATIGGTSATIKGAVLLTGGAGADDFAVSADAATIGKGVKFLAGAGVNSALFSGALATIAKSATGNAIEFTGGADGNTLSLIGVTMNLKGNLAFTGGAAVDNVTLDPIHLKLDGSVTVTAAGEADAISLSPTFGTIKGAVNLSLGEGDGNDVQIEPLNLGLGSSLTITGGSLADSVSFINAGSVTVKGAAMLDLGGGSGASANGVELSSAVLAFGSSLTIKGTPTSALTLSSIASSFSVKGLLDIEPFGGDVLINLDATQTSLGGLTVKTGAGADTIELSAAKLKVGGPVLVETGAAVDTISVTVGTMDIKGGVTVNSGDSADIVTIAGDGNVKGDVAIDLGAGDDGVSFADIGGNSGIAGNLKIGGKLTIDSKTTDTGMLGIFEEVTLKDLTVGKAVTLDLGVVKSDVTIDNLIAKDVLTLNLGDGANDLEIEQDTLFGPSVFSKAVTINFGAGDDTFRAGISSAIGSSSFVSFLAAVTVNGGAGTMDGSNDYLNDTVNFFAPGVLAASLPLKTGFEVAL